MDDEDKIKLKHIKRIVEIYKGDMPLTLKLIRAMYFFDTKNLMYKRVPSSIRRNVMRLCAEYNKNTN
jgi:hypothetical protein